MSARVVVADGIDPDLQMLIDNAPPFDDDQRHGLRELLQTRRTALGALTHLPSRVTRRPPAEAA